MQDTTAIRAQQALNSRQQKLHNSNTAASVRNKDIQPRPTSLDLSAWQTHNKDNLSQNSLFLGKTSSHTASTNQTSNRNLKFTQIKQKPIQRSMFNQANNTFTKTTNYFTSTKKNSDGSINIISPIKSKVATWPKSWHKKQA